jgi:signal transduction histidine kinase/phage shock protein PspC (stress-responsive transcriptional regulator)
MLRSSSGRVLAGVASGLARHLGVPVLHVRLAFVLLTLSGGTGLAVYAGLWVFAPLQPDDPADPAGAPGRDQRDLGRLLAVGSLVLGVVLLLSATGLGLAPQVLWPLVVAGAGVVILWRQADDAVRARWRTATGTSRWSGVARSGAGVALVLAGAGSVLYGPTALGGTGGGLLAALVVTVGLALVTGPWWVQMARDLSAERSARIREQERAEVAAHVHDSVLHTLTLIQRHVDDPREVARLARSQERELRGWLYRPTRSPGETVGSGLAGVVAEVEDGHGVTVDLVVVGDLPLDDRVQALMQATREALVNAAKYAGEAGPISVYAEVDPDRATVYVRDRGPGFDPEDVPADRLGLRQSVVGRMERHGGSAVVRSRAGEGTEIRLDLPVEDRDRRQQ